VYVTAQLVSRIIAYIFNYKSHVHDNMLRITYKTTINLAEIRIFLIVFRFIQNSYVRQGYFTALLG
jgi:hypothetical protein